MICGALQTLNEEAFEDVVASERPSPTGGPSGETNAQQIQSQQQPLTPIQETLESDRLSFAQNCNNNRRRLSPIISITPSIDVERTNTMTSSHASSISSMSSAVSLLISSIEPTSSEYNNNNDETPTSTVILMPYVDDTRL